MNAGTLRHRITFEKPVRTRTQTGGTQTTYESVATVSAQIEPASSFERTQAQQLQQDITHRVVIRYRPDIDSGMRFQFRGRHFEITGLKNPSELNQWLELRTVDRGAS